MESKYSKCLVSAGATLSGNMEGRLSPVQDAQKLVLKKSLYFFACVYRPVVCAILTMNFWLLLSPNALLYYIILYYINFSHHTHMHEFSLFLVNFTFNEEWEGGDQIL